MGIEAGQRLVADGLTGRQPHDRLELDPQSAIGEDRLRALLKDLPVDFRESGLLLVIRTLPGSAHAIAAALDRARWPEVAGSIAGDDTVFVAFPDRGALQRVRRRLSSLST